MNEKKKFDAFQIDLINTIEKKRNELGIPISALVQNTNISQQNYIKKINNYDLGLDLYILFQLCEKMDLEFIIRSKPDIDEGIKKIIEEKKLLKKFRI